VANQIQNYLTETGLEPDVFCYTCLLEDFDYHLYTVYLFESTQGSGGINENA
jgi:hypothetical protein